MTGDVGSELAPGGEASAGRWSDGPAGTAFPVTRAVTADHQGDHCSAEVSHRKWQSGRSWLSHRKTLPSLTRGGVRGSTVPLAPAFQVLMAPKQRGWKTSGVDLGRQQAGFVCFVLSLFGFAVSQ